MTFLFPNQIKRYVVFIFAFTMCFVAFSNNKSNYFDVDEVFSKIDFKSTYYPKEAKAELDTMLLSTSESEFNKYEGYVDYIKAQMLYFKLNNDSSLIYVEKAISIFTITENSKWLAKCELLLGQIAEVTGLYEQAKINYYNVISLLSYELNSDDVGFAYVAISRCKKALEEDYEEDLSRGVTLLAKSSFEEIRLFGSFMGQLFDLAQKDVPSNLLIVAESYLKLNLYERAANVYKFIASSYLAQQEYDSAHVYCDKALGLCEEKNIGNLIIPALYQFKGVLYFKQESFNVSEFYFTKSIALYEKYNLYNRMIYAYDYLHQIDVARNNYSKAYQDLIEYQTLLQKTTSYEKIRLAKVLEVNNKVELMKRLVSQLKLEKKASEFMLYLVVFITIVILGGVGIYIYIYQKNKKARIEELNKEFHNLLIGIGEKQLLEHRLNKKVKEVSVSKSIDLHVIPPGSADIADSFDSCYFETINLFTSSFPQLTQTEVRYAVMVCLKLPMEVIAKVQNVQPASIRKAKQRIRIKLKIEDNLENYLQEFREKLILTLSKKNS